MVGSELQTGVSQFEQSFHRERRRKSDNMGTDHPSCLAHVSFCGHNERFQGESSTTCTHSTRMFRMFCSWETLTLTDCLFVRFLLHLAQLGAHHSDMTKFPCLSFDFI